MLYLLSSGKITSLKKLTYFSTYFMACLLSLKNLMRFDLFIHGFLLAKKPLNSSYLKIPRQISACTSFLKCFFNFSHNLFPSCYFLWTFFTWFIIVLLDYIFPNIFYGLYWSFTVFSTHFVPLSTGIDLQ